MARTTGLVVLLVVSVIISLTPMVHTAARHPLTAPAMAQDASEYELFLPLALRHAAPAPVVTATATSSPGNPTASGTPTAGPTETPTPTPSTVPPAAPFELEAIPPAITNSVPGQRCVFLVAVRGSGGGAESAIELSASAPGAEVFVVPGSARPGEVAEVTVIPAADQQETTVPITIRGARGGESRQVEAGLDVLADMPGVDEERAAYAATVRDRFVPWLEANHPELGITTASSWTGTIVTPRILVVMHYLFFSPEWEMHVEWHVMIPPYDWARIDLRHRFDETRPSYAFEIESWSADTEPRPTEVPEQIWR